MIPFMRYRTPAWLPTAAAAVIAISVGCGSAALRAGAEMPRLVAPTWDEYRDQAPLVDSAVEVVRKTSQGYLVTPRALIPFTAIVRADHGLERLAYVVTAARLESPGKFGKEDTEQKVPVEGFARLQRQRGKSTGRLPVVFPIVADDASSALDLSKLPRPLPATETGKPPPHYRLRVCLEATDNDVETGPHTSRGETFTFVVVTETELLLEIAIEEECLELGLEDWGAKRLRQAQSQLHELNKQLAAAKPAELGALGARAYEVRTVVTLASVFVHDVHTAFRRILRELKANRVRADMIDRVEKTICGQMDEVLRRQFAQSVEALRELYKCLDGDDAAQARKVGVRAAEQLDALVGRSGKVVDAVRELRHTNRQIKTQRILEELLGDRE